MHPLNYLMPKVTFQMHWIALLVNWQVWMQFKCVTSKSLSLTLCACTLSCWGEVAPWTYSFHTLAAFHLKRRRFLPAAIHSDSATVYVLPGEIEYAITRISTPCRISTCIRSSWPKLHVYTYSAAERGKYARVPCNAVFIRIKRGKTLHFASNKNALDLILVARLV